jgi:hypothetical protein
MSGSSIVSPEGQAIGVLSVDLLSPVLTDTLPPRLLRRIVAPRKARKRKLPARFDVSSERTFGLSGFCTLRILARRNRKLPDFRHLIAQRYQFTVLARLPLLHLVERFPSCDDDTPARLVASPNGVGAVLFCEQRDCSQMPREGVFSNCRVVDVSPAFEAKLQSRVRALEFAQDRWQQIHPYGHARADANPSKPSVGISAHLVAGASGAYQELARALALTAIC